MQWVLTQGETYRVIQIKTLTLICVVTSNLPQSLSKAEKHRKKCDKLQNHFQQHKPDKWTRRYTNTRDLNEATCVGLNGCTLGISQERNPSTSMSKTLCQPQTYKSADTAVTLSVQGQNKSWQPPRQSTGLERHLLQETFRNSLQEDWRAATLTRKSEYHSKQGSSCSSWVKPSSLNLTSVMPDYRGHEVVKEIFMIVENICILRYL